MTRISEAASNRTRVGVVGAVIAPAPQDRRIHSKAVPCPVCKAEVEQDCLGLVGANALHPPRRRMAIRALNATGEADLDTEDLRFAQRMPNLTRRSLRKISGLSAEAIGEVVGVSGARIRSWETTRHPNGAPGAKYGAWLREQQARAG